jgi:AhpD family alkylhydroperoxidase
MSSRLDLSKVAIEGYRAVAGLERYVKGAVDGRLLELIKLRASFINGCAFCVDMHSQDALKQGEDIRRLFGVAAWHDAPFYTDAERAALALTDEVTKIADGGVSDEVWDAASKEFSDEEIGNLLLAIATINVWNRLSISTRTQPPLEAPASAG